MSSSNKEEIQVKKPKYRRPSLKTPDNSKFDPDNLLKHKNKRNSVSFGQSSTFQFKEMKAKFQESKDINKKETVEKHKKFVESRRKSIQNEFSLVKEMMKNKMIEDEDEDDDEEVKQNTTRNVKLGHDALEEMSESSKSSQSEESEDEDKEDKEDKDDK